MIDADPQGSLTASLGYVEPDELGVTLATIMTKVINEDEISEEDGILHQNNLYGKEKTEPETDDRRNPFDYGRFQNQLCEGYCGTCTENLWKPDCDL